jgi:hypothetical protein
LRRIDAALFAYTDGSDPGGSDPLAAMIIPPTDVILSWPPANYDHPETRAVAFLVVNSLFLALSVAAVLLRLYARIFVVRWFGIDDVLIIVAIVFSIALNGVFYVGAGSYGWNRHLWDIPLSWSTGTVPFVSGLLLRHQFADCILLQYRSNSYTSTSPYS